MEASCLGSLTMWAAFAACCLVLSHNTEASGMARRDVEKSASRGEGLDVQFSRWPESVWAPVGDDVSFECRLSLPPEQLGWRFRRLAPEAAFAELPFRGPRLTVKVTDDAVQGDYQCIAWYGVSALASPLGTLRVSQVIDGANILPRRVLFLNVPAENPVLLRCIAPDVKPPPTLLYYRLRLDGSEETDSGHVITSRRGGSEAGEVGIIGSVSAVSSGEYGCSARAALGASPTRALGGFRLRVHPHPSPQPPGFVEDMYAKELQINTTSTLEGVLGSEARLECGAIGWPVPVVSWTKDGHYLAFNGGSADASGRSGRLALEFGGRLLYIADLRSEDEGTYACTASNGLGSARRSRFLRILRPAKFIRSDRSQPSKTSSLEGGSIKLHCNLAEGSPRPLYYWLLNGVNATSDNAVIVKGPDLLINRVEKRHAGIVQCFVTNNLGQDSMFFLLTVIPMQINGQPGSEEESIGALRGASSLDTNAGSPKRHHRGRKGSRKHKGNAVMVPPSRPNVTRLSDESVMVRWSVPQPNPGLPIKFFKVQYKELELSTGSWMTANQDIPPHVQSYSVDGLTADKSYRFRVAAVYSNNDNKLGPTSGRYHLAKGAMGGRPTAPIGPEAIAFGPNRLRLTWEYPASAKIRPDGFYCYYRPSSSAGEYFKASAEGPGARELLLPHLLPDTPYELKLQAFIAGAASDFSNIIVARTAKRDPPVNATSGSSVEQSHPGEGKSATEETSWESGNGLWTAAGAASVAGLLLAALSLLLYKRYRRAHSKAASAEKDANIGGGAASAPMDCHPLEPRANSESRPAEQSPDADADADTLEVDRPDREAGSDESTASLAGSEESNPTPPTPPRAPIPHLSRPPPYSCKDEIRAQMGHRTPHTHHTYV